MDSSTKWRYIGSGLILSGIFAFSAFQENQPQQGTNLCTGKPDGNVVILIDHSEEITPTTHKAIEDRVVSIVTDDKKVQPNYRVSVFLMTDDLANIKPIFEFCRPPTGGNPFISNPQVQAAFHNLFVEKIKAQVSAQVKGSSSSPIMETLSTIGRTSYFNENRKQLIIFSDLIEYSKNSVDLYQLCSASGNGFANGISAAKTYQLKAEIYPHLNLNKDINVELHQIPRPANRNIQNSCLIGFWQDAFGFATPLIDPLP